MAFLVEMEISEAAYTAESDTVSLTVIRRLINEANSNVVATKTHTLSISQDLEAYDVKEMLRTEFDASVRWGNWLMAASKVKQMIGQKLSTRL